MVLIGVLILSAWMVALSYQSAPDHDSRAAQMVGLVRL